MNADRHKFTIAYDPNMKEWTILDDGVLHSSGHKSSEEANTVIAQILGSKPMSQNDLISFTKDWKKKIRNFQ